MTNHPTRGASFLPPALVLLGICLFFTMFALLVAFPGQVANPLLFVAVASTSGLLSFALLRRRFGARLVVPALVAVLVMLPLALIPGQRRDFLALYRSIRPGMAASEVERLLESHYPHARVNGWPTMAIQPDLIWLTLDPRTGAYNSEFIRLSITHGCVASKEYLPD